MRRHMIEDRKLGANAELVRNGAQQRGAVGEWQADFDLDEAGTRARCGIEGRFADRRIAEARDKNFVAGLEIERAQYRVEADGRVLDEDQILMVRADSSRNRCCCLAQLAFELDGHEARWVALDPHAPLRLGGEYGIRRQAEAAMIQMGDCRIQLPFGSQCRAPLPGDRGSNVRIRRLLHDEFHSCQAMHSLQVTVSRMLGADRAGYLSL